MLEKAADILRELSPQLSEQEPARARRQFTRSAQQSPPPTRRYLRR